MDSNNYIFFLALGSLGFFSNSATVIYIARSFNIQIHVYSLLFIDSLISTACALTSLIIDLLLVFDILSKSFVYCVISHLSMYIPFCFGAILTFMDFMDLIHPWTKIFQKYSHFKSKSVTIFTLHIIPCGHLSCNISWIPNPL